MFNAGAYSEIMPSSVRPRGFRPDPHRVPPQYCMANSADSRVISVVNESLSASVKLVKATTT